MRSLAELGIALSVVFGIFVLALLAELCYIFCWKKSSSSPKSASSADCIKSAINIKDLNWSASAEYVREASLVGSFGGYNVPAPSSSRTTSNEVSDGGVNAEQGTRLLSPIEEESKEDLELLVAVAGGREGGAAITKLNSSHLRNHTPSDVLTIQFTSGSTSPAASSSFTTPRSSPPQPPPPPPPAAASKLSPYAARAPSQIIGRASPPPAGSASSTATCPAVAGLERRMPLRLLFERSPLLAPEALQLHIIPSCSPFGPTTTSPTASVSSSSSPHHSAPLYRRLSLAALFGQSPTASACSPASATLTNQQTSPHRQENVK